MIKSKTIPAIYAQDQKYEYDNTDVIRTHLVRKTHVFIIWSLRRIIASRTDKESVENRKSLMIHNVK